MKPFYLTRQLTLVTLILLNCFCVYSQVEHTVVNELVTAQNNWSSPNLSVQFNPTASGYITYQIYLENSTCKISSGSYSASGSNYTNFFFGINTNGNLKAFDNNDNSSIIYGTYNSNNDAILCASSQPSCDFEGGPKYLMAKLAFSSTDIYYGWIKLESFANGNVLIHEYAFNHTPNTPVLPGEMGTSTNINSLAINPDALQAYPNPSSNGIYHLDFSNQKGISNISVFDIYGKSVYNETITYNSKYEIDLSNQKRGVYFVKLINENKSTETIKLIYK